MAIASQTIINERIQADGKIRTLEEFVTDSGTIEHWEYDRDPLANSATILAAHAVVVWDDIIRRENQSFVDLDVSPVFVDSSKADLIAFVREAYRNGDKDDLIPLARWILDRIMDGTVTDTQVQNAFGLTTAQWTTLKTKMQNIVSARDTIDLAVGE